MAVTGVGRFVRRWTRESVWVLGHLRFEAERIKCRDTAVESRPADVLWVFDGRASLLASIFPGLPD